jgi:hypothetical protein
MYVKLYQTVAVQIALLQSRETKITDVAVAAAASWQVVVEVMMPAGIYASPDVAHSPYENAEAVVFRVSHPTSSSSSIVRMSKDGAACPSLRRATGLWNQRRC